MGHISHIHIWSTSPWGIPHGTYPHMEHIPMGHPTWDISPYGAHTHGASHMGHIPIWSTHPWGISHTGHIPIWSISPWSIPHGPYPRMEHIPLGHPTWDISPYGEVTHNLFECDTCINSDSNVGWANVGRTSGRQYRRWANLHCYLGRHTIATKFDSWHHWLPATTVTITSHCFDYYYFRVSLAPSNCN